MIDQKALSALKEFQKKNNDNKINLEKLSKELGISGIIEKTDSTQGVLGGIGQSKDEKYYIIVEPNQLDTRKNFTIAHEIAHFILHQDLIKQEEILIDYDGIILGNGDFTDYLPRKEGITNEVEAEANRLAADILMPFDKIKKLLDSGKEFYIDQLADEFGVSKVAMAIRLEKKDKTDWY